MKGDLDAMEREGGVDMFAQGARDLGIGQGNRFLPGTLDDYAEDAGRVVDDIESKRGAIVGNLGGDATVDQRALAGSIRDLAGEYPAGPGTAPLRSRIAQEADAAEAMGDELGAPWEDVNRVRKLWGEGTNFAADARPPEKLRQGVYGALNNELEDAISLQNPGAGAEWRQLGQDERVAIQLRDVAKDRLRGEAANRVISPSDYASVGLGMLAGGGYGYSEGGASGAGIGAGLGAMAANRFVRGREHGYASRAASGLSSAANWIGDMAAPAAQGSALGGAAAGQEAGRQEGVKQSRGYLLPQAAMQALQNGGQELGPYAQQFAEAAASQDSGALSALIARLSQTDQQFRAQVLPRLQMMTAEGGF